ncbi:hypothetical protein, partial [Nocardia africana]
MRLAEQATRGPQPAWRPRPETLRVLRAVDVVLDRNAEYLPISLRQVFYVLLSNGLLTRTEREYKRMCEYVGMARRAGRINWDAIGDDTQIESRAHPRSPTPATSGTPSASPRRATASIAGSGNRFGWNLLWYETADMVPQLTISGQEYGIAVFSGGGFDGLSGKHADAQGESPRVWCSPSFLGRMGRSCLRSTTKRPRPRL